MTLRVIGNPDHYARIQGTSTAILGNFLARKPSFLPHLDLKTILQAYMELIKIHKGEIVIVNNIMESLLRLPTKAIEVCIILKYQGMFI